MKNIMMAAVAASFVATSASAITLPSEGQTCADVHENISRFNPTELSDFQKCVAIEFDHDSGVVGKNVWVRIGEQFSYTPIADLRGKSRDEAATIIADDFASIALVTELEEQVELLEGEIDVLEAAALEAGAALEAAEMTLTSLRTANGLLETANTGLQKIIDDAQADAIMRGEKAAEAIAAAEAARTSLNGKRATLHLVKNNRDVGYAFGEAGSVTIQIRVSQGGTAFNINGESVLSNADLTTWAEDNIHDEGGVIISPSGYGSGFETIAIGSGQQIVGYNSFSFNLRNADSTWQVLTIRTYLHEYSKYKTAEYLETAINEVYEQAYKLGAQNFYKVGYGHGYEDGYSDGYRDGYADGFSDGVASVTN